MECLGVLFILILVVVATVAIVSVSTSSGGQRKSVYDRVAARFGATRVPAPGSKQIQLKFRYRDESVRVLGGGSTRRHWTKATLDWPEPSTSFEFAQRGVTPSPELASAPLVPLPGEWNRYYTLRANDVDVARRFLTAAVLWRIRELDQSLEGASRITVHRGSFTVAKNGFGLNVDRVDRFLRIALQIFDLASIIDTKGIEFVESTAELNTSDARCGVCGEKTVGAVVLCSRCKTPHHKECWEYMGGCSVYACGGKSCVTPSVGKPEGSEPSVAKPSGASSSSG